MSASILPLRDYQRAAIDALWSRWEDNPHARLAVVLPTGSGKTIVFAHLTAQFRERAPRQRAMVLVHTTELVDQTVRQLHANAPGLRVGVLKASRAEVDADVIVASVQTARMAHRRADISDVGLLIVDECFPSGTLVGGRPIESLRVGDMVPSWDHWTGEVVSRPVTAVMSRRPSAMVQVTFDDGVSITCTPNHPLLTPDGWLCAGMLTRGGTVLGSRLASGWTAPIRIQGGYSESSYADSGGGRRGVPLLAGPAEIRPTPGREVGGHRVADVAFLEQGSDGTYGGLCPDGQVYNIEVAETHTYLVGAAGIVAHNCHHAAAASYRAVMADYPDALTVGFTATLSRADDKSLGEVWDAVAYQRSIREMIDDRHLIRPIGREIIVKKLDLDAVKTVRGDLSATGSSEALTAALAPETVAQAYAEHASDRKGILFAPSVESAGQFADALVGEGIAAELVHGAMPADDRLAAIDRLHDGKTQVVTNCAILIEGFDCPSVSAVVMARPTKSAPLYVQAVGRGLRVDPMRDWDDQDCMVMDVVGIATRHSLASLVDLALKAPADPKDPTAAAEPEELTLGVGMPADLPTLASGPTEAREFDPLTGTREAKSKAWARTAAGVPYLSVGGNEGIYVILVPGPHHTWSVAWCTQQLRHRINGRPGGMTEHRGLDMGTAVAWGIQFAESARRRLPTGQVNTTDMSASWRYRAASTKMLNFARQLGHAVEDGMRANDVSVLISGTLASHRIDPIAAALAARETQRERTS